MDEALQARVGATPDVTLAYRAAVGTIRPIMRALTRQDWQGAQCLPARGGCVIAANHISHADPFAVAHFLFDNGHPPFFLGKASLFELPLLGRWLTACEQVPVHRGDGRAVEAFRDAVAAVGAGRCVVVTEACPRSSWTTRTSAPPWSRCVANECRSVWGDTRSGDAMPDRSDALRSTAHALCRESGLPRVLRNTVGTPLPALASAGRARTR